MPNPGLHAHVAFSPHGTFAVSLFLCLAYVVWFCSGTTLRFLALDQMTRFHEVMADIREQHQESFTVGAVGLNNF
jgi:hypothetical protein